MHLVSVFSFCRTSNFLAWYFLINDFACFLFVSSSQAEIFEVFDFVMFAFDIEAIWNEFLFWNIKKCDIDPKNQRSSKSQCQKKINVI